MEKNSPIKGQEINNLSIEERKKRNSSNKVQIKDKSLPWWVELLFVQIGLPDKWLVKLLKTKKDAQEFYKNDKKFIVTILLFIFGFIYLQPVIKYSRIKVKCQTLAEQNLSRNKETRNLSKSDLQLITTNICSGGDNIDLMDLY